MRAYYASPYRSHVAWPDRHHVVRDAVLGMMRLKTPEFPLRIVWHWREVAEGRNNVVWSPLVQGDMIRARILHDTGREPGEEQMLRWCLYVLRNAGFDTLIWGASIPRRPDYGPNGMDRERAIAAEAGLTFRTDVELVHA